MHNQNRTENVTASARNSKIQHSSVINYLNIIFVYVRKDAKHSNFANKMRKSTLRCKNIGRIWINQTPVCQGIPIIQPLEHMPVLRFELPDFAIPVAMQKVLLQ